MTDRRATRRSELVDQLAALGVQRGGVLLAHTSFRAIRPVEGGVDGLIDALLDVLGTRGTLVMPSWGDRHGFDPALTESSPSLGAVPAAFWRRAGVSRSRHPFAFAAVGPHATEVLRDPLPLPPHRLESPVGRVYELDGQVLLLGVDHDANTTIHLGEVLADVPYMVPKWTTVVRDGRPERLDYAENDHCCEHFKRVGEWLRQEGSEASGAVGHGTARLVRSADVVRVVQEALRDDPLEFLHEPGSGCEECDEAHAVARSTKGRGQGPAGLSSSRGSAADG